MKARLTPPKGSPRDHRAVFATCWIAACFILGGASNAGILGNLLLQLGATAIIAGTIHRGLDDGLATGERPLAWLLAGLLAWIAITLIPLPPFVWSHLPGRGFVVQGYRLMGMDLPWLPISLADDRTVRSALSLLVPVASYLSVRRLDTAGRKRVAVTVVIVACLSVLLGLAQLLGGQESRLRPYENTNQSSPVGLFANTNHLATLLLAAIPLAIASLADNSGARSGSARSKFTWYAGIGAAALFVSGLLLIGSNAGLLLMVPAIAAALLLGPWRKLIAHRRFILGLSLGFAAFAGLVVAGFASGLLTEKVGSSATSRTHITGVTLQSARDFLSVGSGLGSFPAIYLKQSGGEGTNREWMNHAHDDVAEVLLELGLPGLALMALFALWMARNTVSIWGSARAARSTPVMQAASLAASLIVLHSFVDYPLRTAAIAALFGSSLALMTARRLDSGMVREP